MTRTMTSRTDAEAPRRFRVLVVDDDEIVLRTVSEFLHTLPLDLETAPSGPAALQKFRRFHPHLVLLDVEMPGIDGFEVCARLRKLDAGLPAHVLQGFDPGAGPAARDDDEGGRCRILFLSAHTSAEDVVRAHEAGADGYIRKPFAVEDLRRRVDRALGLGLIP